MKFITRLLRSVREPSSFAGAALTAVGLGGVVEVLQSTGEAGTPSIASGEFAQALGIVIAGILAILLKEKADDDGR